MVDLKAQKPAKRYAEAIFQIVKDKEYKEIMTQIRGILRLIQENEEFNTFMFHPSVSIEDKKSVMKEIFSNCDPDILAFMFLLIDEGRLDCLDEIEGVLVEKLNDKNKIKHVDITLVCDADEELKNKIISRIEAKLQSKIMPVFYKDENIIGGMILKIKDTLVDLSVKSKMETIKRI